MHLHARRWLFVLGTGLSLPALSAAQAGVDPLPLRLDPQLREAHITGEPQGPVFGRAQRIHSRVGRETTLRGDAEIRRAGAVIRADRITYYETDD
ncbi:MAG TPA: hypothetical protein VM491_15195, partial [Burkholderiaceae bacterium]|nr:hypothetical protein [Burkholderiaceae bacterium]